MLNFPSQPVITKDNVTIDIDAVLYYRIAAALPDGDVATYLLGMKYLEALPSIAQGKGSTIFLPSEATGVMGALGGLKELLKANANTNDAAIAARGPSIRATIDPKRGAGGAG